MKYILVLIFNVLLFCQCQAQSKKLIRVKPIDNIEETPIYPRLTEEVDGNVIWKSKYQYIDSIEMNWISYMSDGLKVIGLMVKPKKPGKYPCIIYNRGGNRSFGQLLVAHAALPLGELASQGYVVIASNYRGNGKSEGQEEYGGKDVNDVLNLIDALEEIEAANTERIGMYGWSRGGMMTYLALTKSDRIDAACVGGAPSDLTIIDRPEMEANVYAELIPDYETNKDVELKKRSAIFWADQFPKDVPILVLHGNSDWRVNSTNSLNLAIEFEKHRVPYRLKIFEGGDHGISEHKTEVNEEVFSWFRRFLKEGEALPNMEPHGR